ncbi:methyltransferase domain-containing protein [Streptomyces sp. NPDC005438]|uniref:class I SAM-dependent methyltransferase n=1 Tax=Streptomyces sp. NPDC005438 TaxID=3156880 RepID=UPI0033A974B1
MHRHGHAHDGTETEADWDLMVEQLEDEVALHRAALEDALAWVRERLGSSASGVRRVLDLGSGPGAVTVLLARAFPESRVVAVDGSPELLRRTRERAEVEGLADRVEVRQARLPEELGTLEPADLVWSRNVLHHLGDQRAGVTSFAELVRPGGALALLEGGLPRRFLPRDPGVGRPGLQARLDAAHADWFEEMRRGLPDARPVVEHWPGLLAEAGLTGVASRTFLTDLPAPADPLVRRFVTERLARMRDRLGERLEGEDRVALEVLTDPEDPRSVGRRADVFCLSGDTLHLGRRDSAPLGPVHRG